MQDSNVISLPVASATGAIAANLRVGIDSNGEAVLASNNSDFLGTLLQDVDGTVAADGSHGRNIAGIQLKGSGIHYATASGVIAVGAKVDPDTNGKVVSTVDGSAAVGTALEAAASDGDIIRVVFN